MGVTHLKAYRKLPEARIAAVCDAVRLPEDGDLSNVGGNLGPSEPFKLDMNQVKGYRQFDELLKNPEVEVIDLCVPTQLHPSLAIAALQAGKHVVCEKPMARNSTLARQMVEAAAASGKILMPAMCMRFWPQWLWLKKAIDENTYGRVLAARFRRIAEPPAWGKENYFNGEQSGGALFDLHIHDTDFVQYCFGRPTRVFSTGLSLFSGAVDHVVTQYQVASGACVSAEGGWIVTPKHGFTMSYTVIFESATADYDIGRTGESLRLFEKGKAMQVVDCPGEDGYYNELNHMIQSIQSGQAPTIVTAQDGLSAVQICEAEERSVKSGQPEKV